MRKPNIRDDFKELNTSKEGQADRFNMGKLRWGLVDFEALEPMVRVLEYGCLKYDDHNWKKGLPTVDVCESLMRHLIAYMQGEDLDPESGLPHIGHLMCNAMFLSYYDKHLPEMDSRYIDKNKQ